MHSSVTPHLFPKEAIIGKIRTGKIRIRNGVTGGKRKIINKDYDNIPHNEEILNG